MKLTTYTIEITSRAVWAQDPSISTAGHTFYSPGRSLTWSQVWDVIGSHAPGIDTDSREILAGPTPVYVYRHIAPNGDLGRVYIREMQEAREYQADIDFDAYLDKMYDAA
jgi:hypothetical protein